MSPALLTTLTAVVVALITVGGTVAVQRMSGRITTQGNAIDQSQEWAKRADERAQNAEKAADAARAETTALWTQFRAMQTEVGHLQQQLDWSKGHIGRLTQHINDRKGPPPPPLPEGLHWPGYQPPASPTGSHA